MTQNDRPEDPNEPRKGLTSGDPLGGAAGAPSGSPSWPPPPAQGGGTPGGGGGWPPAPAQAGGGAPGGAGDSPERPRLTKDPRPGPAPVAEPEPEPRGGTVPPPGYGYGSGAVPPGAYGSAPPAAPPAGQFQLAEWWQRLVAYLLDGLIIGVVSLVFIFIVTAASGGIGFLGGDETGIGGLIVGLLFSTLIVAIVALLYAPAWMARTNGQTIGRQVVGIRVVRVNGRPTDFWWSMLREVVVKHIVFAGLGSSFTFGIAWLLDGLWPLWDDQSRALHDMIVDSRVVRA